MDRFAFKIDNALKANLCKICRLCGVDHPFMVPILSNDEKGLININEPDLYQKIYELIGFTIHRNDNMPQRACAPCVDKINDFFDFREMCYTTEAQTRKLMGLKCDGLNKDIENVLARRGRKRKADEIIIEKPELPQPSSKKGKLKDIKIAKKSQFTCNICQEEFDNDKKLKVHLIIKHDPFIPRYFCYACDHVLNLPIDVKNHDIWHKVTKTPLICGFCDAKCNNRSAFNKHMRLIHGKLDSSAGKKVLDRVCPGCKGTYLTPFLYNMHKCALKTLQCGGCNGAFRSPLDVQRHLPKCVKACQIYAQNIPVMEDVRPQVDEVIRIKNEADLGDVDRALVVSSTGFKRVDNLLRVTMNTLESIKQEPENNINNSRWQNEDYNYNNGGQFQDDDDGNNSNQQMPNEPIVQLSEGTSTVNYIEGPAVNELPIPRLKIKKEHGTLNSSVINNNKNNNNQMETNTTRDSNVNNNNRIPPAGMLKIKQERMDEDNAVEGHGIWNNITSGGNSEASGLSSIKISHVTSGIEFNEDEQQQQQRKRNETNINTSTVSQDIKPNIAELNKSLNVKKRRRVSGAQSHVVVKTEPIDRDILPRITSVTAGVNMLGFNIKTEIKAEPQYENYENHTENVWQQPEHVTIKQERVRIKEELNEQLEHVTDRPAISKSTNVKSRVDNVAETNEIDDQEVILLDSPPPLINLEPDMEIINLDSPVPMINEEADMELMNLNSPAVTTNTENIQINKIDEINAVEIEVGHAEHLEHEQKSEVGLAKISVEEIGPVEVLENKVDAEKEENIALAGKIDNVVKETEKEEEIAQAEVIDTLEETDKQEDIAPAGKIDNVVKETEKEEEIAQAEVIDTLEEVDNEEEISHAKTIFNAEEEHIAQAEIIDNVGEALKKIEQAEIINNVGPLTSEIEEENYDAELDDEIEKENKIGDDEVFENKGEIVKAETELSNLAQPFQESNDCEEEESNLVVEEQNELNQQRDSEILAAQEISKIYTEEVENLLNESVDPASQFPSLLNTNASSSNISNSSSTSNNALIFANNQVLFDNNINEIAENNNNANIERELSEVNATESTASNACL